MTPATLRKALLKWYDANARDLPWRRSRDPYAILVSELMLQQTQVKTALPYYERFLKRFSTVKKLAKADEQEVLLAWAGLGYYRRARFLHAAARRVVALKAFPKTLATLRELPGVGEYTAAAVGSIAFGLREPVVDGNVIRVLSRALALKLDPSKRDGAQAIQSAAKAWLDPKRPGDFNQAMMELGALICAPVKPACALCPLSKHCRAHALGKETQFPRLPARAVSQAVEKVAALLARGGGVKIEVLLAQRVASGRAGDTGRMQGLWQLPEAELLVPAKAVKGKRPRKPQAPQAQAQGLAEKVLGVPVASVAGRLAVIRHSVTRYSIRVQAFWFKVPLKTPAPKGWEWVALTDLKRLPLAAAEKRVLLALQKAIQGEDQQPSLGLRF